MAATNIGDQLSSFSNYGRNTVDLGAPGGTGFRDNRDILSTLPGGRYGFSFGTSMAAPHVAGAAALLLAEDPSLTPTELKNILMTTVDPVNSLQGRTVSGGRLNVNRAILEIANPISNRPPIAENDAVSVAAGTSVTIPVLANDFDEDGDRLSVIGVGTPNNGNASINNNRVRYFANSGFVGTDSFIYTISDGNGGTDTAVVSVTVNASVNNPPVASDDFATTATNAPVTVNVLANDFDADGDQLAIANFDSFSSAGGTVSRIGNSLRYTPATFFSGNDNFTYTIFDSNGGTDTATVSVNVEGSSTNLGQIGGVKFEDLDGDGFQDVGESGLSGFTIYLDLDGDGFFDAGEPSDVSDVSGFYSIGELQPGTYRVREVQQFGFVQTTPDVTVSLASGEEAFVEIGNQRFGGNPFPNQSPVAISDSIIFPDSSPIAIDVLANDVDLDGDPISLIDFDRFSEGGSSISRDSNGTPLNLTDDLLIYNRAAGARGSDRFTYTISDDLGNTDTGFVTVITFSFGNRSNSAFMDENAIDSLTGNSISGLLVGSGNDDAFGGNASDNLTRLDAIGFDEFVGDGERQSLPERTIDFSRLGTAGDPVNFPDFTADTDVLFSLVGSAIASGKSERLSEWG